MAARHEPSADCFVLKVKPGAEPEARKGLSALGQLEQLEGSDLLLLRPADPASPRQVWEQILESSGAVEWAAPLMVDDTKHPHFPTGEISVRFVRPPSEQDLAEFGTAHGLEPRRRNEYVAEQVSFSLREPRRTFLPDLLQALDKEQGVRAAWANTLSRYRRLA